METSLFNIGKNAQNMQDCKTCNICKQRQPKDRIINNICIPCFNKRYSIFA